MATSVPFRTSATCSRLHDCACASASRHISSEWSVRHRLDVRSDLVHESGDISVRPMLDQSSVFDAMDRDAADLNYLAGWLVADTLAEKRPACRHSGHNLVVLGDHVVDGVNGIGKGGLENPHVLPYALAARRQVWEGGVVVDVVDGDQVVNNIEVSAIQLREPAENDLFALLARHVMPSTPSLPTALRRP